MQVMGPVVDVEFEDNDLPFIKDALEVDNGGKRCVMEVAQHIGNNTVRCIMLAASEGLHKDMEVVATGSGITVPVGQGTLGRLFNVLGDTLDGGKTLEGEKHWCIHRDPPSFEDQSPVVEVLEIDALRTAAEQNDFLVLGGQLVERHFQAEFVVRRQRPQHLAHHDQGNCRSCPQTGNHQDSNPDENGAENAPRPRQPGGTASKRLGESRTWRDQRHGQHRY